MENKAAKLSRDDLDKFYSAKYNSYKDLSINIIVNMMINSILFFTFNG